MIVRRDSKRAVVASVSQLKLAAACPRKAQLSYGREGAFEQEEETDAITIGRMVHSCLEVIYRKIAARAGEEEITQALESLYAEWEADENSEYVRRMIDAYRRTYEESDSRTMEIVEVEEPLVMKISDDELDLYLVGVPDAVVRISGPMGGVFNLQHKTLGATVGMDNYGLAFQLDWHNAMYVGALQERFGAVKGSILNLLRKVKWPKSDSHTFHRVTLYIPDSQVEAFKREALHFGKILARVQDDELLPKVPSECRKWNRLCRYFDLCCTETDPAVLPGEPVEREPSYVDVAREVLEDQGMLTSAMLREELEERGMKAGYPARR